MFFYIDGKKSKMGESTMNKDNIHKTWCTIIRESREDIFRAIGIKKCAPWFIFLTNLISFLSFPTYKQNFYPAFCFILLV